jgi:Predicted integral membrane protein
MFNSIISPDNTLILWSIILVIATFAIFLENRFTIVAKISGAIMALIIALILSNLNIIPLESKVYDDVWGYVVPIAIPLLLFQCDIKKIWKESGRLAIIFLLSSLGTMIGAIVGFYILKEYIPSLNSIAGTMTASYIGGGVNFVAVQTALNLDKQLASALIVSDNLLMVLYFFVLIIIPSIPFFNKYFKREYKNGVINSEAKKELKRAITLEDVAFNFTISVLIVAVSFGVSNLILAEDRGYIINFLANKYILLTSITVILATVFSTFFKKLVGSQEIGTFLIYIFFAVIGIPASIKSIIVNSPLLLVFCAIMVIVNMIVTFAFAKIFNFTLEEAILVSNANIGGPTTATAMAISKGWNKYIAPVMLVGTLGYVIGTYIGLILASNLI